jgi:isopentenyldiphosphate isomerase
MEIWDLYTADGKITGESHVRGEELPEGRYHLVVHVWITDGNGNYLISKRAESRPTYPLMWECVGGSVLKGESSAEGAVRETKEEVGVDLLAENGKVVYRKTRGYVNGKKFNDIMDVWLFRYDGDVSLAKATTDEVAEVHWMTREQIEEIYAAGLLVPTLEYFFTEVDKL